MTDNRILAQCTVDALPHGLFSVNVWGQGWCEGHEQIYTLAAKDDNCAAQEGLRRFCEEMECLAGLEPKD